MTSQGNTGVKRWMLGSVAQKIARYSAVPVLVLHEKGPVPAGPHLDTRPLRVLVPLDGSTLAKSAIEPAAQLAAAIAAPGQGSLHFMQVIKPPTTAELRAERKVLRPYQHRRLSPVSYNCRNRPSDHQQGNTHVGVQSIGLLHVYYPADNHLQGSTCRGYRRCAHLFGLLLFFGQ
jgi:nucleotide-binding universal stress UspA family protein